MVNVLTSPSVYDGRKAEYYYYLFIFKKRQNIKKERKQSVCSGTGNFHLNTESFLKFVKLDHILKETRRNKSN